MKQFNTTLALYNNRGKKIRRPNINGFFSFQLQSNSGVIVLSGMGGYRILELNVHVFTCCPGMLVKDASECNVCLKKFKYDNNLIPVIAYSYSSYGLSGEWQDLEQLEVELQECFARQGVLESIVEAQDALRAIEYFGHYGSGRKNFWQRWTKEPFGPIR